jgi:hypothetical protein
MVKNLEQERKAALGRVYKAAKALIQPLREERGGSSRSRKVRELLDQALGTAADGSSAAIALDKLRTQAAWRAFQAWQAQVYGGGSNSSSGGGGRGERRVPGRVEISPGEYRAAKAAGIDVGSLSGLVITREKGDDDEWCWEWRKVLEEARATVEQRHQGGGAGGSGSGMGAFEGGWVEEEEVDLEEEVAAMRAVEEEQARREAAAAKRLAAAAQVAAAEGRELRPEEIEAAVKGVAEVGKEERQLWAIADAIADAVSLDALQQEVEEQERRRREEEERQRVAEEEKRRREEKEKRRR